MPIDYENLTKERLMELLPTDPHLYVEKIDLGGAGRWQIALADSEDFRKSIFLDNRIKLVSSKKWVLSNRDILQPSFPPNTAKNINYIFHISHVGSTLISRLLGEVDHIHSLREPVVLRNLSGFCNEIHLPESRISPRLFNTALSRTLFLLTRRFRDTDIPVIKSTSYANVLADQILASKPSPQSLMVFCTLENYLPVILKGSSGWRDIVDQSQSRIKRLYRMLNEAPWSLYGLSPGELIAMSWLSEMLTLWLACKNHPSQVLWIDFDDFLTKTDDYLQKINTHLDLKYSDQDYGVVLNSGLLMKYSKGEHQFGPEDRIKELDQVREKSQVEIKKGLDWLTNSAARYPIVHEVMHRFMK
jgi:hypothetical protein